jgi:putative protein kinase ArgK-like GTPase of G3E family
VYRILGSSLFAQEETSPRVGVGGTPGYGQRTALGAKGKNTTKIVPFANTAWVTADRERLKA